MLSFIDLIDITDSAAQDLEATISLLGIIKDRVYQFAEIHENNDAFDLLAHRQGINHLLLALDGFELSLECVKRTLADASKDAEESRDRK